ncbi:MAG: hypothetical protein LBG14_05225, partial [Treponema sp.]|nr:hypothetical protein [Treponema sp.]
EFTVAKSEGNVADTTRTLDFKPFRFNLVVEEAGFESKTVVVTINVVPDLTGVAVFTVEEGEGDNKRLVRVQDLPKWKGTADQKAEGLIDAIAWVDTNHDTTRTGNVEYLIRVEHSEAMPRVVISCRSAGYTEIRLRGVETPVGGWEISHDGSGISFSAPGSYDNNIYAPGNLYWQDNSLYGFINLHDTTWGAGDGRLALALENKVTLKGVGLDATPSTKYRNLVHVKKSYRFIMRDGSRVTGHNSTDAAWSGATIYLDVPTEKTTDYDTFSPVFRMEGGTIDYNKVYKISETIGPAMITFNYHRNNLLNAGVFSWTGGTINNNVCIKNQEEEACNKIGFVNYSYSTISEYDVSLWNGGITPVLSQ